MKNRNDEKLEQVVTQALRGLPPRRAPGGLEARVLGELQRRASLVWWRRSFGHWPAAARAGFVFINVVLVAVTLLSGFSNVLGGRSFADFTALVMEWLRPFFAVLSSLGGLTPTLVHAIPQGWLFAALAVGAVLYAALFGLGAAAYRTLYLRPATVGNGL